jgi:L-ectoine synthase
MIVRYLEEVHATEREVEAPTFTSRRFLLRDDGLGFSFHDTVLYAGTATRIWYKHHLEAVYCIAGEGELDVEGDQVYPVRPGMFYALDGHEKHELRATTDLRMMCVFTPALTGREVHNEEGVYPLHDDAVPAVDGHALQNLT